MRIKIPDVVVKREDGNLPCTGNTEHGEAVFLFTSLAKGREFADYLGPKWSYGNRDLVGLWNDLRSLGQDFFAVAIDPNPDHDLTPTAIVPRETIVAAIERGGEEVEIPAQP